MNLNREFVINKLQLELTPKRFQHTLGVEETAIKLAKIHGVNCEKAMYAALLHDCAKDIPNDRALKLCTKYTIDINEFKDYMQVLHSFIGAKIAQEEYKINDNEILNAIKYHTTGRANMSLLEKIVFIADYIEPNRKQCDRLDKIREIVLTDLDKAVLLALNNTILYLKSKDQKIHYLTNQAKDYYTNN